MADLARFLAALEGIAAALDRIPDDLLTQEDTMPTTATLTTYRPESPPRARDRAHARLDAAAALLGRGAFATAALIPPVAAPTRAPRRTEAPRLRIRALRAQHVQTPIGWMVYHVDADGHADAVRYYQHHDAALAALPGLLDEFGLTAPEAGGSGA